MSPRATASGVETISTATSGALLISANRMQLVVDFRYVTAARELASATPDLAALEIELADSSLDRTLAEVIERQGLQRIGIEAAYVAVSRFNKLSCAIASNAPPAGTKPNTPRTSSSRTMRGSADCA